MPSLALPFCVSSPSSPLNFYFYFLFFIFYFYQLNPPLLYIKVLVHHGYFLFRYRASLLHETIKCDMCPLLDSLASLVLVSPSVEG
jgi:hypothetical protein